MTGESINATLNELGWDEGLDRDFADVRKRGWVPGRVSIRHKGQYSIMTEQGEIAARIKGYLRYTAETFAELPVVGDWVAVGRREHENLWRIHAVLPRRTELRRKVKGTQTKPQVLAANMTTVVIVMGLTEDFNVRRLERYLVLVNESGARPFVILNKSDLVDRAMLHDSLDEIRDIAGDVTVAPVSAKKGKGIDALKPLLHLGETLVFIGSSGQGKSTLINALLGEERFATGAVRDTDGRGRHTTTRRELVLLPSGAIVIDSPGIREIQLWETEEGLEESFADIEQLAAQCRFADCTHTVEPGCAVIEAIESEELKAERLESYRNLKEELERLKERGQELGEKPRRAFKEKKRKR